MEGDGWGARTLHAKRSLRSNGGGAGADEGIEFEWFPGVAEG